MKVINEQWTKRHLKQQRHLSQIEALLHVGAHSEHDMLI
jgi:hypothetical protein